MSRSLLPNECSVGFPQYLFRLSGMTQDLFRHSGMTQIIPREMGISFGIAEATQQLAAVNFHPCPRATSVDKNLWSRPSNEKA